VEGFLTESKSFDDGITFAIVQLADILGVADWHIQDGSDDHDEDVRATIAHVLSRAPDAKRPEAFLAWAVDTFGPVAKLRSERLMRFLEEAVELAHADHMERSTLDAIANRVYSRPRGDARKEIGQAQATLETLAENIGESASELAQAEFLRVQAIPRTEWERRHAAKQAIGIAEPAHPEPMFSRYKGPY
jgi:hypothetical protein